MKIRKKLYEPKIKMLFFVEFRHKCCSIKDITQCACAKNISSHGCVREEFVVEISHCANLVVQTNLPNIGMTYIF